MTNSWIFCLARKCSFMAILLMLMGPVSQAQEIDATVSVDRSQLSGTSLNYLENLDEELEVYINEHSWISPNFQEHERIKMDLQITLLSVDNDYDFEAQIVIQSLRPIYNSTRETPLFLFNDSNWSFTYTPNRTLRHDELQFNELTSLIDFYVYVVLGYDFDSFEQLGGTPYYSEAQDIISLAQSASANGWERSGSNRRGRVQLVSNLLSGSYESFREAIYQYHRQGLDVFVDDPPKARQQILQALRKIQEAERTASSRLVFDTFFNAKYREITSIFEDADPQVRLEAYNLLSDIDSGHLSEYQKLQ